MPVQNICLRDEQSGAVAEVLVGFGFNCHRFEVQHRGQPISLLWSVPNFISGQERASASGIPVLFPFPGRIGQACYEFAGKSYELSTEAAPRDPLGNAIHGFVLNRPWRLIEQSLQHVAGEFQASIDEPSLLSTWPADFRIRMTYTLQHNTLSNKIEVENPSDTPLPFGFGTHPYFRVPLAPSGQAAQCRIQVPANRYWPLEQMLPTDEKLPVDPTRDLREGVAFSATQLDDVLADLDHVNGWCVARIDDPAAAGGLELRFDQSFAACVVYNPPHREAVCIEPYSCVPDPFALAQRGIDSSLQVLPPGGKWQAHIDMTWVESAVAG